MHLWKHDYSCEADENNQNFLWAIVAIIVFILSTLAFVGVFSYRKYFQTNSHDLLGDGDDFN